MRSIRGQKTYRALQGTAFAERLCNLSKWPVAVSPHSRPIRLFSRILKPPALAVEYSRSSVSAVGEGRWCILLQGSIEELTDSGQRTLLRAPWAFSERMLELLRRGSENQHNTAVSPAWKAKDATPTQLNEQS